MGLHSSTMAGGCTSIAGEELMATTAMTTAHKNIVHTRPPAIMMTVVRLLTPEFSYSYIN